MLGLWNKDGGGSAGIVALTFGDLMPLGLVADGPGSTAAADGLIISLIWLNQQHCSTDHVTVI